MTTDEKEEGPPRSAGVWIPNNLVPGVDDAAIDMIVQGALDAKNLAYALARHNRAVEAPAKHGRKGAGKLRGVDADVAALLAEAVARVLRDRPHLDRDKLAHAATLEINANLAMSAKNPAGDAFEQAAARLDRESLLQLRTDASRAMTPARARTLKTRLLLA